MPTSRKKKTEETICVCLATDYAVSVAVVRMYHADDSVVKPIVLFSRDELIPLHERDLDHTEQFISFHAKKLLESCRSFHGNLDRLVCVIGSSWTTTTPRSIHIEKGSSFKVTHKTVSDALAKDIKLFEQEMNRDLPNASDFGVIGTATPMIDVNGYRTSDWNDAQAKSLDIYTAVSIAEARFVETIIGAFMDVFHRDDISIESMDHARTKLFPPTISGTVLDIGARESLLSVIQQGVVTSVVAIPGGVNAIETDLMREFFVTRTLVPSVMHFATDEKISEHERDIYYQRIKNAYVFFSQMLSGGIQQVQITKGIIPEPLIVMGHPSWISVFHPLIESDTKLKTFVSDEHSFHEKLLFAHEAESRSSELCLAILQSIGSD
jgi:hypothetical protein